MWLKIKELGLRRISSLVPFAKGGLVVHVFEPQPPMLFLQRFFLQPGHLIQTKISEDGHHVVHVLGGERGADHQERGHQGPRAGAALLSDGAGGESIDVQGVFVYICLYEYVYIYIYGQYGYHYYIFYVYCYSFLGGWGGTHIDIYVYGLKFVLGNRWIFVCRFFAQSHPVRGSLEQPRMRPKGFDPTVLIPRKLRKQSIVREENPCRFL